MVNDIFADTLIRIKNGYLAGKKQVEITYSKIGDNLIKLLVKNKFAGASKIVEDNDKKTIIVNLSYNNKTPSITNATRVSKPSFRVYVKANEIPYVLGGLGVTVISTPKGLMTGKEAKKQRLGGELLCKIW